MAQGLLNLTSIQNVIGFFQEEKFKVKAQDTEKVYITSGVQKVFTSATMLESQINDALGMMSILDMSFTPRWVYPTQPTERGLAISDTKIRVPVQAKVRVAFPSSNGDTYLQVLGKTASVLSDTAKNIASLNFSGAWDSITDAKTLYQKVYDSLLKCIDNDFSFNLITPTDTYYNMFLTGLPNDFTPENITRNIYTLEFVEVMREGGEMWNVADAVDLKKGFFEKITSKVSSAFMGAFR